MKDQIKKILQDYFDAVDAKFIDGHVSIEFDDLATRLNKAIGIDRDKLEQIIYGFVDAQAHENGLAKSELLELRREVLEIKEIIKEARRG